MSQFNREGMVTKTEARAWLSRITQNVAAANRALNTYTNPEDWEKIVAELMEDAGGSAATLQGRLDENGAR